MGYHGVKVSQPMANGQETFIVITQGQQALELTPGSRGLGSNTQLQAGPQV